MAVTLQGLLHIRRLLNTRYNIYETVQFNHIQGISFLAGMFISVQFIHSLLFYCISQNILDAPQKEGFCYLDSNSLNLEKDLLP